MQQLNEKDRHIYKILITGGPCAGKTSALGYLRKHLEKKGFRVILVPQLPTELIHSGVMIMMSTFSTEDIIQFQSNLIKHQMATEEFYMNIARMYKKPTVVICDRGVIDPRAYVQPEVYQAILDLNGWNECHLRDSHYDAVIFLQTAANGAEEHYTLDNNVARYEGLEAARMVNDKTKLAVMAHPNYFYVGNKGCKSFEEKLSKVTERFDYYMEDKGESKRKTYLVEHIELPADLFRAEFQVVQTILSSSSENYQIKLVKRGQNKNYTYYIKEKRELENGTFHIRKMFINASEYVCTLGQCHPERKSIERERVLFCWNGQLYRYDYVPSKKLRILVAEVDEVPPFVKVVKDITTDKSFMSFSISKKE